MKKLRFIYDILWFFRVDRLLLLFCRGTLNIYWHGITTGKSTPRHINYQKIERQIRYFKRHFNLLPLGENGPKSLILSFDDGYLNLYFNLIPLIEKYNLNVTIFVTTIGLTRAYKLGPNQDDTLIDEGWRLKTLSEYATIGAHGHTHMSFTWMPDDMLYDELIKSKQLIEGIIGKKVDMFCFPFGDFTQQSITDAKYSGYTKLYGCDSKHPEVTPRYGICTTTSYEGSILKMLWKFATSQHRTTRIS